MVSSRVASSSLHLQSLHDIGNVQASLNKLTKQISSGNKASTYDELNGVVERVVGYESKLKRIDMYKSSNNSVAVRLKTMDQSMDTLRQVAEDYRSILVTKNGPGGNAFDFASQAEQLLAQAAQALNTEVEGRYIFGGSNTNTPPIAKPIPRMFDAGRVDDNYYQGNDDVMTARISDSLELQYGVAGNDPAFQKLFAAIRTGIESANRADQGDLLEDSGRLINEAIEDLATTRADINSNLNNLNTINDGLERQKLYWKEALGEDTGVDIAEASIKLSTDQTILQATFQAFASMSRLKLTDFLG